MSDQHQSGSLLTVKFEQQVADMLAVSMVKTAGGFVGKQQRRLLCKGTCQSNTLLFATRKL